MKRSLLRAYRYWVPQRIKDVLANSLMGPVAGLVWRVAPHPDLGFLHARHLAARGKGARAAALYARRVGGGTPDGIDDPLFACRIEASDTPGRQGRAAGTMGRFALEFGYFGLKVTASLQAAASMDPARLPGHLDILLDGRVLRSERLTFRRGRAVILFTVKRRTLASFAPLSRLGLRLDGGEALPFGARADHAILHVPHGNGDIAALLDQGARLDKKGNLNLGPNALRQRQDGYLALYQRANAAFQAEFGRPLFLVCGTLLGQHREGDFIAGDDDFDAGYAAKGTTTDAVKAESIAMIERLVAVGFTVSMNRAGKAMRISDAVSGPDLHLDVTPVFTLNDGHVWLHKLARLPLEMDGFRQVRPARLRGAEVLVPACTEAFLHAYYGPGWRQPDPAFTYTGASVPAAVRDGLAAICLTPAEQAALMQRLDSAALPGAFVPIRFQRLYPLVDTGPGPGL